MREKFKKKGIKKLGQNLVLLLLFFLLQSSLLIKADFC